MVNICFIFKPKLIFICLCFRTSWLSPWKQSMLESKVWNIYFFPTLPPCHIIFVKPVHQPQLTDTVSPSNRRWIQLWLHFVHKSMQCNDDGSLTQLAADMCHGLRSNINKADVIEWMRWWVEWNITHLEGNEFEHD